MLNSIPSLILSLSLLAAPLFAECIYLPAKSESMLDFCSSLSEMSDQEGETFASINAFFDDVKESCHQFVFKYPIRDSEQAALFAKALKIKAQEAHRFVPVISACKFLETRNLGFSRQVQIKGGPLVFEHVLVDQESDSLIFIEEFIILPSGEKVPGAFAAINQVREENGAWFFSGIYLYDERPAREQIAERVAMFDLTYHNMLLFIETSDVESIYLSLKSF